MKTNALAAFAICLAIAAPARAGDAGCTAVAPEVVSMPCHLQSVVSVAMRLDGSATALGLDDKRLEIDVRNHLAVVLPAAIRVVSADDVSKIAALSPQQQARFACTLWTVGAYFPIALFVECGLESLDGDQALEARLLGHTRPTELEDTVRTALKAVVDKVVKDLRNQRNRLRGLSTRLEIDKIN